MTQKVIALAMIAVSVLATIYLYNRFSGKTISTLGVGQKTTA